MASTVSRGRLHYAEGNVLLADANAGYIIVGDAPGRTINVVGGHLIARGGAAAAHTSMDVQDTDGVVAVAYEQAGLTEGAGLSYWAPANVTITTPGPLTAGKGLQIKNTGDACTTATSFDYVVTFTVG